MTTLCGETRPQTHACTIYWLVSFVGALEATDAQTHSVISYVNALPHTPMLSTGAYHDCMPHGHLTVFTGPLARKELVHPAAGHQLMLLLIFTNECRTKRSYFSATCSGNHNKVVRPPFQLHCNNRAHTSVGGMVRNTDGVTTSKQPCHGQRANIHWAPLSAQLNNQQSYDQGSECFLEPIALRHRCNAKYTARTK